MRTLAERAEISRRIADEHRRIGQRYLRTAERLDREAGQMEHGIDPWATPVAPPEPGE